MVTWREDTGCDLWMQQSFQRWYEVNRVYSVIMRVLLTVFTALKQCNITYESLHEYKLMESQICVYDIAASAKCIHIMTLLYIIFNNYTLFRQNLIHQLVAQTLRLLLPKSNTKVSHVMAPVLCPYISSWCVSANATYEWWCKWWGIDVKANFNEHTFISLLNELVTKY